MQGPMVLERATGGPGGGPPGTVVLSARANGFPPGTVVLFEGGGEKFLRSIIIKLAECW